MAREIVLLMPVSGRSRATRTAAQVHRWLRERGIAVRTVSGHDAEDAEAQLRQAVRGGAETVVVVGGDGTVALAAQALAGTSTALGIVPAGTCNDVARALGLPRSDAGRAAAVVVDGRRRRIDLARTDLARTDLGGRGSRYVVSVLAAGFDSRVNERADAMTWPRGPARYAVATLRELRSFESRPFDLMLDGVPRPVDAVLVAVGNGPSYGGGLRITHGALLDDGRLDVVVIRATSRRALLRTYPSLRSGGHTRRPEYEHHRVRSVVLDAPDTVGYGDGERVGALPLSVHVAPHALQVMVP